MKRRYITFAAIVITVLAVALTLSGCTPPDITEPLDVYDFGTDKVPGISTVLGEERVATNVLTGQKNGVQYKEYTYSTSSMLEDLSAYLLALQDSGWYVMADYDINAGPGVATLGKNSDDEGMALFVTTTFEEDEYTIRVEKTEGEITPNEPADDAAEAKPEGTPSGGSNMPEQPIEIELKY